MNKVLLGDVAEEVRENYKETDGNPAVVGLEHLIPGEIRLKEWSEDTNTTFTKAFHKGQVLFGRRRAYLKKAAVASVDGICSGDITVISAKQDKILPELLPFVIQNDDFFDFAVGKSAGSLSPRVKWSKLKEYEFNLPSLPQQRKLAKLLWSFVDAKEAYEDLICQTDELVKSQFIEMFGDPVINDRGWPTKSLKEVAPEYSPTLPEADLYWWLNLDMIETYSGRLLEKVMAASEEIGNSTSTFDESMVLYSKLRPYLNKVFVPDDRGYATTELVGMKPDSKILNKYFLFNLLRGDQFVAYANGLSSGGQMPRIPMKALRDFKCILPPIDLQEQFVETSKQSDKSKFELNEAIKDLDAMYKRIIKDNLG